MLRRVGSVNLRINEHTNKVTSNANTPYNSNKCINMKLRKHHNKKIASNNFIAKGHNRNKTDINGIISIGSGLTVNPSATNLANINSNDYRAFMK